MRFWVVVNKDHVEAFRAAPFSCSWRVTWRTSAPDVAKLLEQWNGPPKGVPSLGWVNPALADMRVVVVDVAMGNAYPLVPEATQ